MGIKVVIHYIYVDTHTHTYTLCLKPTNSSIHTYTYIHIQRGCTSFAFFSGNPAAQIAALGWCAIPYTPQFRRPSCQCLLWTNTAQVDPKKAHPRTLHSQPRWNQPTSALRMTTASRPRPAGEVPPILRRMPPALAFLRHVVLWKHLEGVMLRQHD